MITSDDVLDQGRRLEAKAAALVEPVLGANRSTALIDAVGRFESLANVRELMALSAG